MKHLVIFVKIPLPDDEFEQADILVAGKKLKAAVEAAAAEHLPSASVEHAITLPEPIKAPRKTRAPALSVASPKAVTSVGSALAKPSTAS